MRRSVRPVRQTRNRGACGAGTSAGRVRHRAGAALLEAIVALALLATSGVAVAALGAGSSDAARRAREADARVRRASAFLEAVALWPREDLDRRLGDRTQGPWRLRIERPRPTLYLVTLADSAPPRATVLTTALYRPETTTDVAP